MRDDDDIEYGEDKYISSLVERYESTHRNHQPCYFDVEEFETIIDHYLIGNELEAANEAIKTAFYYHPNSVEIKLKKAEVELENDNAQQALSLLQSIELLAFNQRVKVRFLKARAYLDMGKVGVAIDLVNELLKSRADSEEVNIHSIISGLINQQEYSYAIHYLEWLYSRAPGASILLDLSYCNERLDNIEKAAEYYERYLDEDTFNAHAWHKLGTLYNRLQNKAKAVEAFDFAITLDENLVVAYNDKATTLAEQGLYEKAIVTLQELLEHTPFDIDASYAMGECYEKLGSYDKAMSIYLTIIERDKTYANAYYGVAFVLKEQGRLDESYPFAKKTIELEPDNSEFHYGFGKLLMELEQPDAAVQAFERAVMLNEGDIESWLLLSEIHLQSNIEKALETLERAAVYAYDSAELCFRIAALYFLQSDIDKCMEHFERGLLANADLASEFFNYCPEAYLEERIMTIYQNSKTRTDHDF